MVTVRGVSCLRGELVDIPASGTSFTTNLMVVLLVSEVEADLRRASTLPLIIGAEFPVYFLAGRLADILLNVGEIAARNTLCQ